MRSANLEIVKVGTAANDGSGDPLRTAFVKINSNFSNIYANGRFLGNVTDSKISPGYSWPDAPRSGMYHSGIGTVGIAVDGQDGLVIRNTGAITFNGTALIGGGLGLAKRSVIYGNSSTIATGTSATFNLSTSANTYAIGLITTNSQSRVRLYISDAARIADTARGVGVAYSSNAGVLCDFSTPGSQTEYFTPALIGWDTLGSKIIYASVTNNSGTTKAIQLSISVLPLEL